MARLFSRPLAFSGGFVKRIAIVIILFCSSAHARSQQPLLRSVDVGGNLSISASTILSWMVLKSGSPFQTVQLHRDVNSVVLQYQHAGYYFVSVRPDVRSTSDSSSVSLTLGIVEGPRVTVGTLDLTGNVNVPSTSILQAFDTRVGDVLDDRVLEQDFDRLLDLYETRGFPFANVRVKDVRLLDDGRSLAVVVAVDEGPAVRISEIRVEGNTTTKQDVILRESRLRIGELFNQERIREVRSHLNRLNVFSAVGEPELYFRGTRAGLLIKVKEGNASTFDGILGYVPASGGLDEGYFTGLVSVSMRNLFGTGRKFSMRWQRENRSTQDLGVRYLEPWLLGLPVNVEFGFGQRQQDSTYVRRTFEVRTSLSTSSTLRIGAVFNRQSVIPSSERVLPPPVLNSGTNSLGVDLELDTRDDPISPTEGIYYRTDYQVGSKSFSADTNSAGGRSVTVQRLSVDLRSYFKTFAGQVLALSLNGRELRGNPIDESDLFRFGGTNTLRGYRENQFLGSRVVWSNVEYRFLMSRQTFFYGFVDAGYYFRPGLAAPNAAVGESEASVQSFKHGFGMGIQVETRLGLIGFTYALGEKDTFSTGKIHVGLINQF